jgi:hypothetical protein
MLSQMIEFHSFIHSECYSTVYMYCIFFIHSLVDGHLGYLHVLPVVKSVAVNMRVFFDLLISFPSNIYTVVELLYHRILRHFIK